jgi:hypothetical protein
LIDIISELNKVKELSDDTSKIDLRLNRSDHSENTSISSLGESSFITSNQIEALIELETTTATSTAVSNSIDKTKHTTQRRLNSFKFGKKKQNAASKNRHRKRLGSLKNLILID